MGNNFFGKAMQCLVIESSMRLACNLYSSGWQVSFVIKETNCHLDKMNHPIWQYIKKITRGFIDTFTWGLAEQATKIPNGPLVDI